MFEQLFEQPVMDGIPPSVDKMLIYFLAIY